ncbi:MAG TPA: FAD-binding oxidoreductase [Gaiellaceae bacterium]|jgi:FAD/FMN-containing dehydrogenase|nr:FAD-binding oxidoreductase [Gaiellaceae bacterium]
MTTTPQRELADLGAGLNGTVIGPDDPGYDDARHVFFTGFDRRPGAIVRAADAADVSRVVTFARETGAELAVRSGGHSRAGHGTSEGGIVLDLSAMDAVEIDAGGETAWAQSGVTAGDYTRATGERGLATGFGDTPSVGVGGITLSGGFGFLTRRNGLTIDDLLAAEVVTAAGELLEVDEENHADLFWALRGGGGNFGVATRLRFRLHAIDDVVGGMLLLPASVEVINGLLVAADAAPDELSVIATVLEAPPLSFIPAEQHGKPVVIALMVYAGDAEAGRRAIAPIRSLAAPLADMVRPIRYPEMYAGPEAPRPAFDAGTNLLLDGLPGRAAETILEHLETGTAALAGIQLRVLGGAMARIPDDATAFAHRRAKLLVNVAAMYERRDERPEHEAWVNSLAAELSSGHTPAAYAGFLGETGAEGVRRAYPPATLERLARVKREYDPENLFRLNQNVSPEE